MVVALFIVQAAVGYFVIHSVMFGSVESSIREVNQRVRSSIEFHNGTWDISRYNADPEIPGPTRLYIFANDGFVIDRWRPIPGYMNISDARHLLSYQKPVDCSNNSYFIVSTLLI